MSTRRAHADTLDEVKKRGVLVVGTEAAYVPYEFFKDGKIIGYDPDIVEHFVQTLGVKAQIVDTAWNGIIPALYAKKFDVIISAMTITKERAEKVLFSMPYADASNVILLRAGEERIKTADDLSGKIIGVQIGSAAAGIIKTFEAKLKAGQAGLRRREAVRTLSRGVPGPDQSSRRCGGQLEVHADGGDARRTGTVQDAAGRVGYHGLFRHGIPQGRRQPAGVRQCPARAK